MEYKKCLVELYEILKYLAEEEFEKIPKDIIKAIEKEKDTQYVWKYDESKSLNEQNINRQTIAILSYINMKYLLNEEQKKVMKQLHDFNTEKDEDYKSKKYKYNDIFINKNSKQNESMLIEIKEDRWYKKVFLFFRQIFKVKRK